ncbi:hypothetical protein [Streptomyces sp. NBC_00209]|uniref:hypothetical protein n=1 Tax=Streptomyces sp. NBC_00209 TaxID=2975682 RepID=UPI0032471D53
MAIGRRRQEPEPVHGAGISIGGNNMAPLQNVVGQNISHVHQHATVEGATDIDSVRELLATFRLDLERNEPQLEHADALRAMATSVDNSLAEPAERVGALRGIAQALPALVVGSVVQQSGEALAHAIGGLVN